MPNGTNSGQGTSGFVVLSRMEQKLFSAIKDNDIEAVRACLKTGIDPEVKDISGKSAIHAARGRPGIIRLLANEGFDLEAQERDGYRPMHQAVRMDDLETLRTLAGLGAKVDGRDNWKLTPLHHAAIHGRTRLVEPLLLLGAVPDLMDQNGLTPLMHAAIGGKELVAAELIKHGADPGIRKAGLGFTAMEFAVSHGRSGVIAVLERNALSKALDGDGLEEMDAAMGL